MNIKAKRYAVTVDKASGIKNNLNEAPDHHRSIVDLIKRVVRVSEPPRLSRRLQLLRGWGHEDIDKL